MLWTGSGLAEEAGTGSAKSFGGEDDCAEISLQDVDPTGLTDAERIALMERELYRSLSRFDACQTAKSGGGGGGGSDGGAAGDSGNGDGAAGGVEASGIRGDDAPSNSEAESSDQAGTWQDPDTNLGDPELDDRELGDTELSGEQVSQNGATPDDIPPGDNDSVLERQIRKAAEAEKDPEKRKKLWNEYRRYKGMEQQ
ncbi:MAG: hypothetical protein ACPGOV_08555 [Magnetovibrionaceae bacterium]